VRDCFKKASNGKLDIRIAYGSSLGPERQMPEAIKSGGYEGGMMCAGYYPNKFPLLQEAAGRPGREMLNFVKGQTTKYGH
jgi:TRAP-type C4-dicarboxylate transport system substrate-binding protein